MKHFKSVLVFILFVHTLVCNGQSGLESGISLDIKNLISRSVVSEGNQDRLQRLFARAARGEKLVLGVIGGSITEGASCPNLENRYPSVVLRWWQKTFPDAGFELVNAGIGATGSNYGAMRVKRDLLSKKPDFVIIEYGVNDANSKECAETLEGVVRQVLNSPSQPVLLLLFMMNKDGNNAQEWHSKIGYHYGLPMVSYRDALWPEIQAGKLKWTQISPDVVHPNEAGHVLTGELVCGTLENAFKKFDQKKVPALGANPPVPLISDSFEFTSLLEKETLVPLTNHNWTYDGAYPKSAGWKSSVPGSILEFEISGKQVFLSVWKIRGPMGRAGVSVDGGAPVTIDAWFDQTWGGYSYMVQIGKNLSPGKHKIRIEILNEKNPESSGNEYRVLSVSSADSR